MLLESQIESILFVVGKSVSTKELATALNMEEVLIFDSLQKLKQKYQGENGIHLIESGDMFKFVSNPANIDATEKFIVSEIEGDLTKPQLETLTMIAYLGPITRPELEEMRGVNCGLILKNLLIRGLIVQKDENIVPSFILSTDALQVLGVSSVTDLPDYENLRNHEFIQKFKNSES